MNTTPPAASPHATRRSVLAWTGAGLATALTAAWPAAARAAIPVPADSGSSSFFPPNPAPPDTFLNREQFLPHLGFDFEFRPSSVDSGSAPLFCRLIEVSPNQDTGTEPALRFVSFSLLFSCAQIPAEGGIHRLAHPALPELDLFLSPVGKNGVDGSGNLEAVCSQRLPVSTSVAL